MTKLPQILVSSLLLAGMPVPIANSIHHYIRVSEERVTQLTDVSGLRVVLPGGIRPEVRTRLITDIGNYQEDPFAARLFVVHLAPELDFREDFRSRRLLKEWVEQLDPSRDLLAVHREGALSQFSANKLEMERLIDFFGTEFDRFDFGPRRTRNRVWLGRSSWPFNVRAKSDQPADYKAQRKRTIRGDFRGSLARIRTYPGRKILLHFGNDLPFASNQLEYHDSISALQWAQEIGLVVYGIVPKADPDSGAGASPRLQSWVRNTGGQIFTEGPNLVSRMGAILNQEKNFLVAEFEAIRQSSGQFIPYTVEVQAGEQTISEESGYFDLEDMDATLYERAFLTASRSPGREPTLPLEISVEPSEFRGLIVELKFPLQRVLFKRVAGDSADSKKVFQEVHLFLGLYGEGGQLLDFSQDRFEVNLEETEFEEFFPRVGTWKRVLEPRTRATPETVRAVVVVGQGYQLATQEFALPEPE